MSIVIDATHSMAKLRPPLNGTKGRRLVNISDEQALRSALLSELSRMKKFGFLVVEEAFEVAQSLDLTACGNLPLTAMAFIASERGYAQFKSRLQREAAH